MTEIDELERGLSQRLHAAATDLQPEPDALAAVRAKAVARRRRRRARVGLTAAAAVALIAGVAVIGTGGEGGTDVATGPAASADPMEPPTTTPSPSTVTVAPIPAADADAALLLYRYPNATAEMIAGDPLMGGEWAELNTATRTCSANGPLADLGAESPCGESRVGELLALVDAGTPIADFPGGANAARHDLIMVIRSGLGTPEQVARTTATLAQHPDVVVSPVDGGDTVTISTTDPMVGVDEESISLTYDVATGHPLRLRWATQPTADIEYTSVTRVRASDVLVPGRGKPNTPSTTTTVVGGEPLIKGPR